MNLSENLVFRFDKNVNCTKIMGLFIHIRNDKFSQKSFEVFSNYVRFIHIFSFVFSAFPKFSRLNSKQIIFITDHLSISYLKKRFYLR